MGRLNFQGVQIKALPKGAGGISVWMVIAVAALILVLAMFSSKREEPKPKKIEPKPDWRNLR